MYELYVEYICVSIYEYICASTFPMSVARPNNPIVKHEDDILRNQDIENFQEK